MARRPKPASSLDPEQLEELVQWRRSHLGRLVLELGRHFQARAQEKLHARGFSDYKLSHNALMVNLGMNGARLVDLAESAGITKQSMAAIANELEELGYIERIPDPEDGRARIIRLAARGHELFPVAVEALEEVIAEYAELVGQPRVDRLRRDLEKLVRALDIELP